MYPADLGKRSSAGLRNRFPSWEREFDSRHPLHQSRSSVPPRAGLGCPPGRGQQAALIPLARTSTDYVAVLPSEVPDLSVSRRVEPDGGDVPALREHIAQVPDQVPREVLVEQELHAVARRRSRGRELDGGPHVLRHRRTLWRAVLAEKHPWHCCYLGIDE